MQLWKLDTSTSIGGKAIEEGDAYEMIEVSERALKGCQLKFGVVKKKKC